MSVTTIEWTHRPGTIGETWNPTTGCNKVDRGCKHCYAEIMHRRLQAMGQPKYAADFLAGAVEQPDTLMIPFRWTKPRTVFVDSMSDLFHKNIRLTFIENVFFIMNKNPQHTFLILTKRPERAVEFWRHCNEQTNGEWKCPPNVWIGTSANDQESADTRIPLLLELDGCLRFLSYEPATGPCNLENYLYSRYHMGGARHMYNKLDWVICGGESGPKAVPMDPDWPRHVRDQCKRAGVPFFFKQWGTWLNGVKVGKNTSGHELDGETIQQFPSTKKISYI